MLASSVDGTRDRSSATWGACLAVAVLALVGCGSQATTGRATTPGARPEVLTVSQLKTMVENGEAVGVILGQIDGSGTVYRLTNEQRDGLRADGMPVAILGHMQDTYEHAIRANPDLAKSNERWIKIGDYWYGGLPAGWPRDWLVGPPPGGGR